MKRVIAKVMLACFFGQVFFVSAASFDLRQVRNGSADSPLDPIQWVGGNASPANAHFIETQSIPYRLLMSDLTPGPHQIIIEWDTRQNGNHAIDYITHYDRIEPHDVFSSHQTPEAIDPLAGLDGPWSDFSEFPIPIPEVTSTPVTGQPSISFQTLPASERVLTMWNGSITNATYLLQEDLTLSSASTRLQIDFIADAPQVVLAWGGHIAAQFDWGVNKSATSIKGSPYHTRVIGLDGSGGNQDVSLQTTDIIPPPPCDLSGPNMIFAGEPAHYEALLPSLAPGVGYSWSFSENTAGASFLDSTNGTAVEIQTAQAGHFTINLTVSVGSAQSVCQISATVLSSDPIFTCSPNLSVPCAGLGGTPVNFTVEAIDYLGRPLTVTSTPPSGSLFPIGATEVVCQTTDELGHYGECRFTVSVVDTEPPQLICPPNQVFSELSPDSGMGEASFVLPTVTDNCDPFPIVICDPLSGTLLPVGDTTVHCTATDSSGQVATCEFLVKVVPTRILTTSTADSGPGTLRQALLDANASPGANIIDFSIPGPGPHTIHLLTPLPDIVGDLVIDATSQPDFVFEPVIELDGDELPPPDPTALPNVGLTLHSSGNTVRGLSFSGFDVGMVLAGSGSHIVQGNYIGIHPDSGVLSSNLGSGIIIRSPGNLVGGSQPGQANVVNGNGGVGLRLETPAATQNIIQGNFIGIDPETNEPMGNGGDGIFLTDGASDNQIGGIDPSEGNHIAFNGRHGIALDPTAGTGNAIWGNTIVSNEGLGIDLGVDGVTPNDPLDEDAGPNQGQNYPEILAALTSEDATQVQGRILTAPGQPIRVELFVNESPDASGFGEGQNVIHTLMVQSDANGLGTFSISLPVSTSFGQVLTATATDADGNTSEFSSAFPLDSAPIILEQPMSQSVVLGDSASFCVTATGSLPLLYQWRLNGANILGATQACVSVPSVQLTDGGTYTVLLLNQFGATFSEPAILELNLPIGDVADDLGERVPINNTSGVVRGTNIGATQEGTEPNHVSKPGGKSVWYSWVAPATGIATISTIGSTFDTLLAVYEGSSIGNLILVGEDEDQGGFFTSALRFNVVEDIEYIVVVDGFGGAAGEFVLNWDLEPTKQLLPIIHLQPESGATTPGSNFTFHVLADAACVDVHHDCRHLDRDHHPQHDEEIPLYYQWLFNGVPIPGATTNRFTVVGVQEENLGFYSVVVSTDYQSLESKAGRLQINQTGETYQNVLTADKFLDAALSQNPLRVGGFIVPPTDSANALGGGGSGGSVVRGFTGTQVFSTSGSTTESGETLICGLVGGASEWITLIAEATGTLHLDTRNSSFDTALAVLARSVTNAPFLDVIDCNDNASPTQLFSEVEFPVTAGQTNFIVLDGVNGASGTLQLNYSLIVEATFTFIRQLPDGSTQFQVSGRPNLNLTLEASPNLRDWTPMLTTNAPTGIIDFIDPPSGGTLPRFYRARLLP